MPLSLFNTVLGFLHLEKHFSTLPKTASSRLKYSRCLTNLRIAQVAVVKIPLHGVNTFRYSLSVGIAHFFQSVLFKIAMYDAARVSVKKDADAVGALSPEDVRFATQKLGLSELTGARNFMLKCGSQNAKFNNFTGAPRASILTIIGPMCCSSVRH